MAKRSTASCNVTWTSANSNTDSIVWSADNGTTWSFVGKQTTPIAHSFPWAVPSNYGTRNLIEVFAIGPGSTASDPSNGPFSIVPMVGDWTQMASLLPGGKNKNIKDGAAEAWGTEAPVADVPNDTGYVYAFKGNGRYEFYRYNTLSNAWVSRDSIPAIGRASKKKAVKKGSGLAVGADHNVYGAKGGNTLEFWCYDPVKPAGQHWGQLTDVPTGLKKVKEGTGLAAVSISGTSYIYMLKGGGTKEFYRYKTGDGTWATMADAPDGPSTKPYKDGSSIAYDGGDTIFCMKGTYNEFFAYSVHGNNWITKDTLPKKSPPSTKKVKAKSGSQLAYAARTVYVLKGNNSYEFWAYKCDSHKWYTEAPFPTGNKKVKGGSALVTAPDVNALYAFRGNNTLDFYKYGPIATFAMTPAMGNEFKDEAQSNSTFVIRHSSLSIAPNPFTSRTNISYSLSRAGSVSLKLYDVTGKLVTVLARGYATEGRHSTLLDATRLAHGIYLLKYENEGKATTNKLIIE